MRTPTVLVLGAGASKPYGLPVGSELVSQIADLIASDRPPPEGSPVARMLDDSWKSEYVRDRSGALADRIRRSRTLTIDAFLENCPPDDRTPIIQAMIDILWRKEQEAAESIAELQGDWLRWLYHHRLISNPGEFEHNQLRIVSFNYDRLPRLICATMMLNKYPNSAGQAWSAVNSDIKDRSGAVRQRTRHVHGAIAIEPEERHNSPILHCGYHADLVSTASKGIQTVGVFNGESTNPRLRAQLEAGYFEDLWHWPQRVFLLGVGYHEANLRKIGLDRAAWDELHRRGVIIGGTALGLDRSDRNRVTGLVGPAFRLGEADQDCLSFLREHLGPDP